MVQFEGSINAAGLGVIKTDRGPNQSGQKLSSCPSLSVKQVAVLAIAIMQTTGTTKIKVDALKHFKKKAGIDH